MHVQDILYTVCLIYLDMDEGSRMVQFGWNVLYAMNVSAETAVYTNYYFEALW